MSPTFLNCLFLICSARLTAAREVNRRRYRVWLSENREHNNRLNAGRRREARRQNPEKYRKIQRRETAEQMKNPQFRIRRNLRKRANKALKGISKSAATLSLLGCSVEHLAYHLESQFRPGMTRENYGSVWEIDHIKPCAAFNLLDPEQQRICFHWTNLQPLFSEENRRKSNKV